jgi:hypothetical protein
VVNYGFSALLSLTVGGLPQVQQDALLKFTEVDPDVRDKHNYRLAT